MSKQKENTPAIEPPASEPKKFRIVGLQMLESMPVHYAGEKYDLASLTDEQADILTNAGYEHIIRV
jgi:hypothetical protein